MARRRFVLSEEEVTSVQQAEAETRDVRALKRLQAVRLYGTGDGVADIQNGVGGSWRALMEWCQAYRAQGVEGLHSHWQGDNALKLSRAQRADLTTRVHRYRPDQGMAPAGRISQGQFWTVSDLKIVVEHWYAVTYQGASSYRRLLHDCGLSQQQTERQSRSRADEQTVADFEALLEKSDGLSPRPPARPYSQHGSVEPVLPGDAHPRLGTRWSDAQRPRHPQRDPIHFYGALDGRTGRDIARPVLDQTSTIPANFICLLLSLFSTQPILLLLDRAPWHFGPDIDQLLQDHDRLELVYYPTACPDLNPQEHVWDQAREHRSHNHTYRHVQALIDAVEAYLNETPFQTDFMNTCAPSILCASV